MNANFADLFVQKIPLVKQKYQKLLDDKEDFANNQNFNELKKVNIKIATLEPLFFLCRDYEQNVAEINELKLMQSSEKDKELSHAITEEIESIQTNNENILVEVGKVLSQNHQDNKVKSIIVEIKGTSGGDEANLFAAELYKMYCGFASKNNWQVELLSTNVSPGGGFASVIFKIFGKTAYYELQNEAGIHRIQRVPKTESKGRVHTSAAAVLIFPETAATKININQADLRIDTYRASGAGGQHVNKTDSAVRITHIPTKLVVASQDGRSQHDNKDRALKILHSRLLEKALHDKQAEITNLKKFAFGSGDRSEKIRTYNFLQDRITDHRVNISWRNINKILTGDLFNIIQALHYHEQISALQSIS